MSLIPSDHHSVDDDDSLAVSYSTDSFFTRESATLEGPSNFPEDLATFLTVAQSCDVDFIPLLWNSSLGSVGEGGSARVDQSVFNISRSFAFKRFRWSKNSDYRLLPLISEVLILSQNAIASHPNIVDLEGICWDVEQTTERLQPVLVFEKAAWNLRQFMGTNEGMQLSIHERLRICADLGDAIATMHAHHVIHGDIKPHNVLVFKDFGQKLSTKMADFGYSTLLATETQMVRLPRSVPWNAPEHKFQQVDEISAKRMDIYSFALLSLWVMFKESSVDAEVRALGVDCPAGSTIGDIFKHQEFEYLKDCDKVVEIACNLVGDSPDLDAEQVIRLKEFFDQSLRHDAERRTSNFWQLATILNPESKSRNPRRPLTPESVNSLGAITLGGNFQIAKMFHRLLGDYRIRKGIIKSLQKSYTRTLAQPAASNIAFQIAFCYHVGFGIPADDKQCTLWLSRSQKTPEDLEKEKQVVGPGPVEFRNQKIQELVSQGAMVINRMETSEQESQTSGPRDWDRVISELQLEAGCMKQHFGELHYVTLQLNWLICNIWDDQGKYGDSRLLREHIWREFQNSSVPETMNMVKRQALIEVIASRIHLGSLESARVLQEQILETTNKALGRSHLSTIKATSSLAMIYHHQGLWKESEELLLRAVEVYKETYGPEHPTTLHAISKLSSNYRRIGDWGAAEELDKKVLTACRIVLGSEHPMTIACMNNLAATYQNEGKLGEAYQLLLSVKDISTTVLGAENPNTLHYMENLAGVAGSLLLWKEGEELFGHVAEVYSELFGPAHPETWRAYHNIAAFLTVGGMVSEALKVSLVVVENRKKILGEKHPDTLNSMYELALAHSINGNLQAAEELYKQVKDLQLETLGKEHPDTLLSIDGLSSTYRARGLYEEAYKIAREVVPLMEKVLGPNHPRTIGALQNLAQIHDARGMIKEGGQIVARVVEVCKTVFGSNHPRTLVSIGNLAATYCTQGKFGLAEEMGRDAEKGLKNALGPEHPDTLGCMQTLANILAKRGKLAEAEAVGLEAIGGRERILGVRHPNTLLSKYHLGSIYYNAGKLPQAENLLSEVVDVMSEVLGEEHPETLRSMEELGATLWAMGKLKESKERHSRVLEARTRILGPEHPETLGSMRNLASTMMALGDLEHCEPLSVRVVELSERFLGVDHEVTLVSRNNLATVYRRLRRFEEAKTLLSTTSDSMKNVFGLEDPRTLSALDTLACTYNDLHELDRAERLFSEVVKQRKLILGPQHSQALLSVHNHANTLWRLHRWTEAVGLEMEAARVSQQTLGGDHPYTRAFTAGLKQMRDSMKNFVASSD